MRQLYISILTIILFSCSDLNSLINKSKPSINNKELSIRSVSLDKISLNLDLTINNPNPVSVPLESFNYRVKVNQKALLNGSTDKYQTLKASSNSKLTVPIDISFKDIYQLISEAKNKDALQLALNADIGTSVPVIGKFNIPIQLAIDIPIPKMPELEIVSFKNKSFSLSKASFDLELKIKNKNKNRINLKGLNFDLKLNNKKVGNLKNNKSFIIDKEEIILFNLDLNVLNAGYSFIQTLISGRKHNYELNGVCDFKLDLPFFNMEPINLNYKGTF